MRAHLTSRLNINPRFPPPLPPPTRSRNPPRPRAETRRAQAARGDTTRTAREEDGAHGAERWRERRAERRRGETARGDGARRRRAERGDGADGTRRRRAETWRGRRAKKTARTARTEATTAAEQLAAERAAEDEHARARRTRPARRPTSSAPRSRRTRPPRSRACAAAEAALAEITKARDAGLETEKTLRAETAEARNPPIISIVFSAIVRLRSRGGGWVIVSSASALTRLLVSPPFASCAHVCTRDCALARAGGACARRRRSRARRRTVSST